ncbi:hypothetical protein D2N39_21415 [Gemmobacter lutimaris]|uniref:Uncharacterized protein n=1 Tax=Gemmobacter lutimaris TaxID=2306023 RepID=A0A398BLC2_9RHOB|nr:DUF6634 family protein [Gemmobacter lutimaris]RID89771.1 hypothetical protein D2N39_21415 [Gemmobacter lutimaris]
MDFDDFLDPYRPLWDELEVLRALFDPAHPEQTIAQFTSVFKNLYDDDRDDLYADDHPEDLAGKVRRFLNRVGNLSSTAPSQEELDRAPVLHQWCAVRLHTTPFLLGQSTGHPLLRWGARTRTSVLMQLSPDLTWARTWNRYYLLSEHAPETLYKMQADGVVSPAVEPIRFDDRLH